MTINECLTGIGVPGELHGEIAGKAIGALNDDGTETIAGDALEHVLEARALRHRVATAGS